MLRGTCASKILRRCLFTNAVLERWCDTRWVNPDGRTVSVSLSREERTRRIVEKIKSVKKNAVFKHNNLSLEGKLLWKLQRTQQKLDMQRERLKRYTLPPDEESEHDPEMLTPEQLQALKKIGHKNKNYVPVGVRGIYGGTIENIHMHWKFHETCQIDLHMFQRVKHRAMAQELARLSGGIVVDINGSNVIMYRGKNYKQPDNLIPDNLLDKRKALFRARYTQSKEMIEQNIEMLRCRIERLREESDVAGLVEKMAFGISPIYPPKEAPKWCPSRQKPYMTCSDFTEDEFEPDEERPDLDDMLYVQGSSDDENASVDGVEDHEDINS